MVWGIWICSWFEGISPVILDLHHLFFLISIFLCSQSRFHVDLVVHGVFRFRFHGHWNKWYKVRLGFASPRHRCFFTTWFPAKIPYTLKERVKFRLCPTSRAAGPASRTLPTLHPARQRHGVLCDATGELPPIHAPFSNRCIAAAIDLWLAFHGAWSSFIFPLLCHGDTVPLS